MTKKNKKNIVKDMEWNAPNRKRPIAYSTIAVGESLEVLVSLYRNKTLWEAYDKIVVEHPYSREEREILRKYIVLGYGESIIKEFFIFH